jgi:hypothetical protein
MNTIVQAVINAAADEADGLLEGIVKPADARPLLLEWLAAHHPEIPQDEQDEIISRVLALLCAEGFFVTASAVEFEDPSEAGEPDE